MSGLPMASPVIMTMFTFSCSMIPHTSWGSNLGTRQMRLPTKLWPMTPHWVAPCMRGAMGRKVSAPPAAWPFSTICWGRSMRTPVSASRPPPRAKNTLRWGHTTPLGMPVVPPV